jgi:hypothetical protein
MFNHHQCSYAWCDQGVRCHLEECTQ